MLSSKVLSQEVPYIGGKAEMNYYVEGLRFPDKDFDGLVTINLSLLEPICDVSSAKISHILVTLDKKTHGVLQAVTLMLSQGLPETPIFTDKVVFRVAPWIMTPNTLRPVEVFVCR